MNIVKQDNQKAIIHLSRIGKSEFFLARAVVFTQTFDGSYVSHVVGVKRMDAEQATELRSKAQAMSHFNITLVDVSLTHDHTDAESATVLLTFTQNQTNDTEIVSPLGAFPSPYASKISILEAFLTSQKTRAPTAK